MLGSAVYPVSYTHLDVYKRQVERFDIPFHCVSHEGLTRVEHDKLLAEKIDEYAPDYIVLAKYMRVLNPEFVARYPNRVINIHHSFLPEEREWYQRLYDYGLEDTLSLIHILRQQLQRVTLW